MPARDRARSAVLILCDGLGAGFLGTYGNGWLATPSLDRFATHSLVVEFPWVDSTSPEAVARSILQGDHACSPQGRGTNLTAIADATDRHSLLISDCRASITWPSVAGFRDCELFPTSRAASCAEDLESTELFSFCSAVAETLLALTSPFFVTIYLSGLSTCWDAPWELRAALADESDPVPGNDARPTHFEMQPDDDPDRLLIALQSYAAQVSALDACLGSTLALMDEVFDLERTMIILTGTRGYPLGQHRVVGYRSDLLHAEQLHVPLLMRSPGTLHEAARCHDIVQPSGIYAALAAWFANEGIPAPLGNAQVPRPLDFLSTDRALVTGGNSKALRVPAWYLVDQPATPGRSTELFVKPDDRWEVNNIASRCPEVVSLMQKELEASCEAARAGQWSDQPALSAELQGRPS